jgi:sugar phosphate isomerase/epimerase
MQNKTTRRHFLQQSGAAALGAGMVAMAASAEETGATGEKKMKREYGISLAAWSLHRTIGKQEGQVPMLDMPKLAREKWDIGAIELVNNMMAEDSPAYVEQFIKNASDHDVEILLIMIDGQGDIGAEKERFVERAVENHKHWIDIAADMGCHSIRMNWKGDRGNVLEDPEALDAFIQRSVPGFRQLCDYGDTKDINVLIENHWGPSSYIKPLTDLMKAVDHPRFGTLPDFGNFPEDVDKYDAVDAFMPYAKAVSAKCYDFDDETGEETKIDYERMLSIVCDKHGYEGYIGIEYEGSRLGEEEGIARAKTLLEKMRG